MTSSHILRSTELRKSLALTPVRNTPGSIARTSFATRLAEAQSQLTSLASSGATPRNARNVAGSVPLVPVAATGGAHIPFRDEIIAAANKHGVDPALLAALVKAESNFNPRAQSGAGAKGLTQLMDATATGLGVTDSFDPAQSLDAGAKFLGGLLKQFHGDERLALAAYNAGPGAVQKYGGVPPYHETQRYVPKVLGYATQFRRIIGA